MHRREPTTYPSRHSHSESPNVHEKELTPANICKDICKEEPVNKPPSSTTKYPKENKDAVPHVDKPRTILKHSITATKEMSGKLVKDRTAEHTTSETKVSPKNMSSNT